MDYHVGQSNSFDALFILNGGVLSNAFNAIIGGSVGANSNLALVSGGGSVWDNLLIGRSASTEPGVDRGDDAARGGEFAVVEFDRAVGGVPDSSAECIE